MLFSERLGFKPVREQLQFDSMDQNLKNSLWYVYLEEYLELLENSSREPELQDYCRALWVQLFKYPTDTLRPYMISYMTGFRTTMDDKAIFAFLRQYFFHKDRSWYEIYDLLQFSARYAPNDDFVNLINLVLEREVSAYRFVNGLIVQIT